MTTSPLTRVLMLGWAGVIMALFYWIHKPITPDRTEALGGAVLDIFLLGLLLSLAGGLGLRVGRPALVDLSRAERSAAAALLGLGALSVGVLAVGVVSLHPLLMWACLLGGLVLLARDVRAWWGEVLACWRGFDASEPWAGLLRAFGGLVLGMALLMALAPETGFDALTYHLVGPAHWVAEGRIVALSGNHFFGFPGLMTTLYTAKFALLGGAVGSAAMLHWAVGGALVALCGGYAARRFGAWAGLLAGTFILMVPSIWVLLGWAYVDLATAAYGMLAFIALDQWRASRGLAVLVLAGAAVGLAMSAKYNALLLGIAGGLYVLAHARRGVLRPGLIYVGVASLVLAPWLLRNLAFFDNPVYPFGPEAYEWDALKSTWYTGAEEAPLRRFPALVLPIFITPTLIGVISGDIFNNTLSPVFLMFIPFLALTWRHLPADWRPALRNLLWLVLLMHLFWLITSGLSRFGAQGRFMYPMLGWVAVLAAASLEGLRHWPTKPLDIAWMMRALLGVMLVFTLLDYTTGMRPDPDTQTLQASTRQNHFLASRAVEVVTGTLSEQGFLEHSLGTHYGTMQRLNDLTDGAHILFLWETRSFYCDEPRLTCQEDTILYRWWHERRTQGDGSPEALIAAWDAAGVTHVLVWETGREFEFENNPLFTEQDITAWEALAERLALVEALYDDDYRLYRLP